MANYDKPYSFNLVLNSQISSPFSSGNPNDVFYAFNWSNIPEGKYAVSFSYLGKNNGDYVANDCPQLFLSISSVPSVYQAGAADISQISTYLGSLRAQTHAAGQVSFYCNSQDNPEVFFNSKPTNGPIRVQVFRDDFVTPFTTVTGAVNLANYVMVLRFKQIGKIDGYNI
jgi:hypothetical protein